MPKRLLDVLIPTFNRPAKLFKCLETGLAQNMEGVYFVVLDDHSDKSEVIDGVGNLDTRQVCEYFNSPNIVYIRHPENLGLARSWERYYDKFAEAKYTMSVCDKDEFTDGEPILEGLRKIENDDSLCMVVLPIFLQHRGDEGILTSFDYKKMSGEHFIGKFVRDANLQHCTSYGIKRVFSIQSIGVPECLNLYKQGLPDFFGIDINKVLMLSITGSVDFVHKQHVWVKKEGGGTEAFPLTFAYTYYQYIKYTLKKLRKKRMISRESCNIYIKFWLLLILRGLVVSYQPIHGTEKEFGTKNIRSHLKLPMHIYVLLEAVKYQIKPSSEIMHMYFLSLKLYIKSIIKPKTAMSTA